MISAIKRRVLQQNFGLSSLFEMWHGTRLKESSGMVALSLLLSFSPTLVLAEIDENSQNYTDNVSANSSTMMPQSNINSPVLHFDSLPAEEISENRSLELYGMEYINDISDYSVVEELGVDTIVLEFSATQSEDEWLDKLDDAEAEGLDVVANYWPEGWSWNDDDNRWDMAEGIQSFLQTIEDHPALLAVYGLHEPYWNNCRGCGYTTLQQQKLYRQIKSIADVQVWSVFSSFQWADQTYGGSDYEFADDVCDYCTTWMYPSLYSSYARKAMIRKLEDELEYFRAQTTSAKFIWVLQAFESNQDDTEMPTYMEMMDLASVAMQRDIDGVTWYTWNFDGSEYPDTLSENPSLWPAVREVYDNCFRDPNSSDCVDLSMQKGDTNCDHQIGVEDVFSVLQFVAGTRSEIGTCQQNALSTTGNAIIGDVNDNGRIDAIDALMLLQCDVGILNEFCGDRN